MMIIPETAERVEYMIHNYIHAIFQTVVWSMDSLVNEN